MSVDHILKNVENRRLVLGIFIDLSKAFDTISHTKLLKNYNSMVSEGHAWI